MSAPLLALTRARVAVFAFAITACAQEEDPSVMLVGSEARPVSNPDYPPCGIVWIDGVVTFSDDTQTMFAGESVLIYGNRFGVAAFWADDGTRVLAYQFNQGDPFLSDLVDSVYLDRSRGCMDEVIQPVMQR